MVTTGVRRTVCAAAIAAVLAIPHLAAAETLESALAQAYRNNPTLNKNVITMLGSAKTRQRATNFLRGVIGHPAAAYLRYQAVHAENPVVRKQAANLARYIR